MKIKKPVSTNLFEVRANASFSTRKPSTVTMEIDKRFSLDAYAYYLDQQENIERHVGLIGFELVAVYEDGRPEPDKAPEEIILDEIEETLNDAVEELKEDFEWSKIEQQSDELDLSPDDETIEDPDNE